MNYKLAYEKAKELIECLTITLDFLADNNLIKERKDNNDTDNQPLIDCVNKASAIRKELQSLEGESAELPSLTRERVMRDLIESYQRFTKWVLRQTPEIEQSQRGKDCLTEIDEREQIVKSALTEPERCDNSKLYPCPYSTAVTCVLTDPCMGCETFSRYLAGEEIPRFKSVYPNIKDTNVLNPDVNRIDITEQFPDTSKNAKQFKSVEPEIIEAMEEYANQFKHQ